ncbi:hypothetical protein DM44_7054 [Burkholderia cepacia]|jgi:hypothetical protein|nr:hypothetical protein DM42_6498 [Burkholderia cepacia]KGC04682.1 hypothetical protein DM44_7054 [Burkholderia cepacia]
MPHCPQNSQSHRRADNARGGAYECHQFTSVGFLAYFAVGIANSAPLLMLDDQRCITDFWRV